MLKYFKIIPELEWHIKSNVSHLYSKALLLININNNYRLHFRKFAFSNLSRDNRHLCAAGRGVHVRAQNELTAFPAPS